MGEYVEKQAVIDLLFNLYERDIQTSTGGVHRFTAEIDVNELDRLPVVKLVRCKDCRFYNSDDCSCDIIYSMQKRNDFCSNGELE